MMMLKTQGLHGYESHSSQSWFWWWSPSGCPWMPIREPVRGRTRRNLHRSLILTGGCSFSIFWSLSSFSSYQLTMITRLWWQASMQKVELAATSFFSKPPNQRDNSVYVSRKCLCLCLTSPPKCRDWWSHNSGGDSGRVLPQCQSSLPPSWQCHLRQCPPARQCRQGGELCKTEEMQRHPMWGFSSFIFLSFLYHLMKGFLSPNSKPNWVKRWPYDLTQCWSGAGSDCYKQYQNPSTMPQVFWTKNNFHHIILIICLLSTLGPAGPNWPVEGVPWWESSTCESWPWDGTWRPTDCNQGAAPASHNLSFNFKTMLIYTFKCFS